MSVTYQSLLGLSDINAESIVTNNIIADNITTNNELINKDLYIGGGLTMPTGAVNGYVLTTDALGISTWQDPTTSIHLAGDVSGPIGANVVDFVGTSSASDIHNAVVTVQAATAGNISNTIVMRDGIGDFVAGNIYAKLHGDVTGNVTGNLTGNVTGNVSGSSSTFTGSLLGDVTGTQSATVVSVINGVSATLNADISSTQTFTNKTLTFPIISSISNSGTITIPTGTDTLVNLTSIQALTNKTLTGITNNIDANTLRNGSTWATALSGSAPATNNVLTYNGTNAVWAVPSATSSVTMGGNVTGSSSSCTVVGAAGNFAVVGNETVGGTLGVTGRTMTAGLTTTLSMYYTAMNKKMFDLQDLGTVTNQSQHNFDGIGMDGVNAINYQAKNTSTSHVFNAATSSTTSNTLMTINGNGAVGVPGYFTKFVVRDTSQQVRLFPATNNAESSISFNTNTAGPASGIEWTMGQGAYGVGASNFGMGSSGTSGGIGNVLTVNATTGKFTIPYGISYNNYASVYGQLDPAVYGTGFSGTIEIFKYNNMVSLYFPTLGTSTAPNTGKEAYFSAQLPLWALPYGGTTAISAFRFPIIITNAGPHPTDEVMGYCSLSWSGPGVYVTISVLSGNFNGISTIYPFHINYNT